MGKSYKWFMLGLLLLVFFFSQVDRVPFGLLTIPIQNELGFLSPLLIGAMSDYMGSRGFEWGFALMDGVCVVGVVTMAPAFFYTFERNRICE